jgi:hypothetical protein
MVKNNYWFKAKRYGWGWYPSTWQGWLVMVLYAGVLVLKFRHIDALSHSGSDTLIGFFLPFVITTTILIIVCYLTGERPRWRWGD